MLRRPTRIDIAIALLATALLIVNAAHREMWHDEINAFEIALHSPTLPALFHNLHYEGHPPLWYLLLWFASSLGTSPLIAQVAAMPILTGSDVGRELFIVQNHRVSAGPGYIVRVLYKAGWRVKNFW